MTHPTPWLTRVELAERWRTSPETIRWREHVGKPGPRPVKFGRRVLYALADVEAYERAHIEGVA